MMYMKSKKYTIEQRIKTLEAMVAKIYFQQKELINYVLEKQKEDTPKE
jgi:hypothetical protein